jgi:hypothetical protein
MKGIIIYLIFAIPMFISTKPMDALEPYGHLGVSVLRVLAQTAIAGDEALSFASGRA